MSDQAAFQEVDDAVRQDDLKAWWKRWGTLHRDRLCWWWSWRRRAWSGGASTRPRRRGRGERGLFGGARQGRDRHKAARAELEQQAASAPEPYRSLAALADAQLLDTPEQQIASLTRVAPKLTPELSDLALVIAGFSSVDAGKLEAQVRPARARWPGPTGRSASARASCRLSPPSRRAISRRAQDLWNRHHQGYHRATGRRQQRAAAMLTIYGPSGEGK